MTITYNEKSRRELKHGYRIVGTFTDSATGDVHRMKFFVDSPSPTQNDIDDKVNIIISNIETDYNPLNKYSLSGGNVKPKLLYIVQYVRDASNCTRGELITSIDSEFPNMLWKAGRLLANIESYLEDELNITQTFDEFKVYLIDNKFDGLD